MKQGEINNAWIVRTLLLGAMSVMMAILLIIMVYALIANQSKKKLMIAEVEEHGDTKEVYSSELTDLENTDNPSETKYVSGREKMVEYGEGNQEDLISGYQDEKVNNVIQQIANISDSGNSDLVELSNIDVEDEVLRIRNEYGRIMDRVSGNQLNALIVTEGVTAYQSSDYVEAIFVDKGVDGYDYSRKYYFDNNHLIFAYYESSDAHRLYFKDDKLFRWRYSPVASNPQGAENHDGDYVDGYQELEDYAVQEGYTFLRNMGAID